MIKQIGKDWLCPWCWVCPYPKPGKHPSALNESVLLEKTLSCAVMQRISETVSESIGKSVPVPIDLTGLEGQLKELSGKLDEFSQKEPAVPNMGHDAPQRQIRPRPVVTKKTLKAPMQPFEQYKDNYLLEEDLVNLADLLGKLRDDGDFVVGKSHGVYQYGQPYEYTGSKTPDCNEPIPEELNLLIEKLTADLSLEEKPNSVLINYFPACENGKSYLAKHSDDEPCITADSKIITVSVGGSRKVVFESKHDESNPPTVLEVKNNSMYVMSRSSQNWYRHGVPPQEANENIEERFSITFRTLNQKFRQSILLMGDSNTRNVNFGTGSGKVGASYPGKRVKAARVKDIDPTECVGYQNVYLHCGTNDLRCENIRSEEDIYQLTDQLHEKLSELKQICPKANVFVVPVLPSRIRDMNRNIMFYNNLVGQMLDDSFPEVWFSSVSCFLDSEGLLNVKLTRNGDKIHLGNRGIALYVSLMKLCVFKRVKSEQYHQPSQESVNTLSPARDS